jgi:hypothetical protein
MPTLPPHGLAFKGLRIALLCGLFFATLPSLLHCASPAPAPEHSANSPLSVELLSTEDLNRALEKVWSRPAEPAPSPIDPALARRESLQRALQQLGPGTALLRKPTVENHTPPPQAPFFHELLPRKIGYLRLGESPATWETQLAKALSDFDQVQIRGLILDFRDSHGGSLAQAASLASLLLPPDSPLFQIRDLQSQKTEFLRSKNGVRRPIPHAVLINPNTAGAPEVLAATLQRSLKAVILGRETAGAAADYAEIDLSGGVCFRYPVREALLEDGTSLFRKGLSPDLRVQTAAETESELLRAAAAHGKASPWITETSRPRLNEAALMAKKNPETEAWIREQLAKTNGTPPAQLKLPRDETLARAVDFLESLSVLSMAIKSAP